jgi:hypothetical protein
MPEEPSIEFLWFLEMARRLAERYTYRWVAIDGRRIRQNRNAFAEIIVADGETLGEVLAKAGERDGALSLCYAFVDPPLEPVERQMARL